MGISSSISVGLAIIDPQVLQAHVNANLDVLGCMKDILSFAWFSVRSSVQGREPRNSQLRDEKHVLSWDAAFPDCLADLNLVLVPETGIDVTVSRLKRRQH